MAASTAHGTTSPERDSGDEPERANGTGTPKRADRISVFATAQSAAPAASTARGREASFLTAVRLSADAVRRLALEPEWSVEAADALARMVSDRARVEVGVARAAVCSRALGDPHLQTLPPQLAADAIVRILAALAPVRGASLWVTSDGRLTCAAAVGDEQRARRSRVAAQAALAGRRGVRPSALFAVPVLCWERPAAALAVLPEPAERRAAERLAAEASAALAPVLEREALLDRGQEHERLLVEASERRLARLAFDIHDGALQTIASLGLELRLLGSELEEAHPHGSSTRVAALHERVAALETELRELTHSLEPSTIARRPLAATLADQVSGFGRLHGVVARFEAVGDVAGLTPSQRIALVRVVHEALANAREHGAAAEVRVVLRADWSGIHLHVTDDGCGFDVGRTLPAAARKGRLGLVGMSERVRLLGGRLDIESRPGGPTEITASLRPWRPIAALAEDRSARAPVL